MKKVLTFVLVALLIVGLAVPAAANESFDDSMFGDLPTLARKHDNVRLHHEDDLDELHENKQDTMDAAEKALKDVDTKGLALRYFFYSEILSDESHTSIDFDMIPHNVILFMQYIDNMWVTMEHSINDENDIITVIRAMDAPLAIFTDAIASPGANIAKLIPVLTDEAHLIVQIHSLEEVLTMSEEVQKNMAEAKAKLMAACPEGFAVKYFFELEVIGTDGSVDVDFEPIDHTEIAFKQYVDGAWVDLEYSIGDDGIITVLGAVNGPVATFTK